jgi:hypothetical protein
LLLEAKKAFRVHLSVGKVRKTVHLDGEVAQTVESGQHSLGQRPGLYTCPLPICTENKRIFLQL